MEEGKEEITSEAEPAVSVSSNAGSDEETNKPSVTEIPKTARPRNVPPHTCLYCGKIFRRKAILQSHLRRHEPVEKYECLKCHKKFKSQELHDSHILIHSPYKCDVCDRRYLYKKNLVHHKKSRHSTSDEDKKVGEITKRKHNCVMCGEKLNECYLVQSPVKAHGPKNNKEICSKCERIGNKKISTKHQLSSQYTLEACPPTWHSSRGGRKLLISKLPQSGKESNQSPVTYLLRRVQENGSSDDQETSDSEFSDVMSDSEYRGVMSDSENDMMNDLKSTNEVSEAKNYVQQGSVRQNTHPQKCFKQNDLQVNDECHSCLKCDKLFKSKQSLLAHMEVHLQCLKCKVAFKTAEALKVHMQTLGDERLISCCLCGHILHGYTELHRHIREHLEDDEYLSKLKLTEERPDRFGNYSCETSASVSNVSNIPKVKISKVKHTGENTLKCSQCGKYVPLRHGLDEHISQDNRSLQAPENGEEFVYISRVNHPLVNCKKLSGESCCKCKPDLENLLANDTTVDHLNAESTLLGSVGNVVSKENPPVMGSDSLCERLAVNSSSSQSVSGLPSGTLRNPITQSVNLSAANIDHPDAEPKTSNHSVDGERKNLTTNHQVSSEKIGGKVSTGPVNAANHLIVVNSVSSTNLAGLINKDSPRRLIIKVLTQYEDQVVKNLAATPGVAFRVLDTGTEKQMLPISDSCQADKTSAVVSQNCSSELLTSNTENAVANIYVASVSGKLFLSNSGGCENTDSVSSQQRDSNSLASIGSKDDNVKINTIHSKSYTDSPVASSAALSAGLVKQWLRQTKRDDVVCMLPVQGDVYKPAATTITSTTAVTVAVSPPVSTALLSDGELGNCVQDDSVAGSQPFRYFANDALKDELVDDLKTDLIEFEDHDMKLDSYLDSHLKSSTSSQNLTSSEDRQESKFIAQTGTKFETIDQFAKSRVNHDINMSVQGAGKPDLNSEVLNNPDTTCIKSESDMFDLDIDIKEEWDITWV